VSLRARLLAAFAYVLVLVIVALEVPLALNLSRRVDAEIKSEAQGQAALLAAGVSGRLGDRGELEDVLERAARDLGGRVIVVGPRGRLLADSAGRGLGSASYASRPEIEAALAGRNEQGTRHSDTLGEDILVTAVPVVRGGRTVGAVRVSQSVDAVQAEVRQDVLALIGVGAVALLLGLGVAWLLAGSLARPLRGLAAAARRVAGGDLEARAAAEGSTEQREVAAAFNDMTGRLGRTLRAQREFVANASHQLRTPLTGLRLRLEAAELKSRDPDVKRELAAADRETERLATLLGQLLTLAREPEATSGERLLLDEEARSAHHRWEAPAEQSGHELRLSGAGDAAVESSRADVAAMLDNLIENALNYSPPGTTVTIEWAGDAGWGTLAVSDEGPGIDRDETDRLFDRFYRGAESGGTEGTGLGLAVVAALAERWGGAAKIANREPAGARAEVRLPAAGLPSADRELDRSLPGRG
jgi:signal transduction histidine kinase